MSEIRIALSAWNGRVSPVFDASQKVFLIDVTDGRETARAEAEIPEKDFVARAGRLRALGADVLLCGAISRPLAALVANAGVTILSFLAGEIEDVLAAYLAGRLPAPEFMMPGCPCPARGRRRRQGHRGGRTHRLVQMQRASQYTERT